MLYIILIILFGLPLLLFLKMQHAFKAFTYRKFVWALNRSALIYLLLCIGFAFLFAWLENTYSLENKGTTIEDITAEIAMDFMMVTLFIIAPLLLMLNIIKWSIKNKVTVTEE